MNKTLIAATVAGDSFTRFKCSGTNRTGRLSATASPYDEPSSHAPLANTAVCWSSRRMNKWPEWDVPGGQLTTKRACSEDI